MRLIDADELEHMLRTDFDTLYETIFDTIQRVPTIDAVPVVRCRDCKWWDKKDESPYGYCHACKHGHWSEHWEISIYRTYKGDWYCADGERKDNDRA